MPIPVRVYWRWFWSPPRGHRSSRAICHLDCMVDSRGGVLWLLIVYRLRCFRLHKDHMHGARWWACTLIMSLYLCAGRSATIRSPWGTSLLSPSMLFFHKYSLLQLSLTSLIKHTNTPPPSALLLQVNTNTLAVGNIQHLVIHICCRGNPFGTSKTSKYFVNLGVFIYFDLHDFNTN